MHTFRSNSLGQKADQYMPAPGSPYRPVLSPPGQIYSLQPGWSNCVITHAFAGIDPPRPLKPAAALVPNLTPTSPQSRAVEATSTFSLKPVPGAAEAGVTGALRDPSPAPAHKVQAAGPKITPSPPSPFTAKNDPHRSETSLDPQDTHAVNIHSQINKWQAPISAEAASDIQASSNSANDLSVQDPSKDGELSSAADTEIPQKVLYALHPSSTSSDRRSNIKSALSPNAVISDSLDSASSVPHSTTHGLWAPATIKEPQGSPGMGPNPLSHRPTLIGVSSTSSFPGVLSLKVSNLTTNSTFESFSLAKTLPKDSYDVEADGAVRSIIVPTSSPKDPFANDAVKTAALPDSLSDAKYHIVDSGGIRVSVAPTSLTDARHYVATVGFVESFQVASSLVSLPSLSVPSSSLHSVLANATTPNDPQGEPSNSTKATPRQQATPTVVSHQIPSKADSPISPPMLSVPNLDLYPVLADADTSSNPQSKPSSSIKAVLGNQTVPALEPSGTSTAGTQLRASSGNTTTLPYKNGVERSTRFCLVDSVVCLASVLLTFIV